MRVFVYLITFAADIEGSLNSFVLLKDGNILTKEMINDSPSSYSIIENMLEESMGITGRWAECMPKLVGVLDDKDTRDSDNIRLVALVYALCIASKNRTNEGYAWVAIDQLENVCKDDTSKNIIRYAATSI